MKTPSRVHAIRTSCTSLEPVSEISRSSCCWAAPSDWMARQSFSRMAASSCARAVTRKKASNHAANMNLRNRIILKKGGGVGLRPCPWDHCWWNSRLNGHSRLGPAVTLFFRSEFCVEIRQHERFAVNLREGFENLELAVGLGFADVNVLGGVVIRLHGSAAAGALKFDGAGFEHSANLVHIERAGFFDRHFP